MSYDQNILLSRTGSKLLRLFDKMEVIMSKLYHTSMTNDKIEREYFEIYDEIDKLRSIRLKIVKKSRRNRMY